MIDYVDATVNNVFSDIITYKEPITDRISLIRKMNKKELDKILQQFKVENTAEIIVLPKEESEEKEEDSQKA